MRDFEGGLACLRIPAAPTCNGQGDFVAAFGTIFQLSGWLNVIPLLIGVFIGAPLVAREVERRITCWPGLNQSRVRAGSPSNSPASSVSRLQSVECSGS